MAIDTEAKRWSMLAFASASRVIVFNPDASGLSSIEKITLLQKYGGNAWQTETTPEVVAGPQTSAGGRVYPYPQDFPKRKKKKVIRQPLPEYEVSGPLARQTALENPILPKWDQDAWEASLKTLAHLEAEDLKTRKKKTESVLIMMLLH